MCTCYNLLSEIFCESFKINGKLRLPPELIHLIDSYFPPEYPVTCQGCNKLFHVHLTVADRKLECVNCNIENDWGLQGSYPEFCEQCIGNKRTLSNAREIRQNKDTKPEEPTELEYGLSDVYGPDSIGAKLPCRQQCRICPIAWCASEYRHDAICAQCKTTGYQLVYTKGANVQIHLRGKPCKDPKCSHLPEIDCR
jgi:hypothetical protein